MTKIGENVEFLLLARNGSQQFRVGIAAPRIIPVRPEGVAETMRPVDVAKSNLPAEKRFAMIVFQLVNTIHRRSETCRIWMP